ncbi:hypothetical protein F511_15137 [Dorcoceras hygrometricum]|uniref:Uncharacterized protein n=1 Tax=Dorcoceras hygrometricum TaxID=472368 RepID=A0A2Z7BAV1_9LAMI|nr:hypothetical protein F511_15137 [Dorcoceras hygrometricum]
MSASGESSTTMHRLLHASGSHPIPPPNDPKCVGKWVKVRRLSCRVSMTFRVVRTNQYNQDLGLIHSINGNHLEIPNEGSSIDHQVTIYLHAQNITMFPTNETWYFASQILVSGLGGLILILMAQSTRNVFRIHNTIPEISETVVDGTIVEEQMIQRSNETENRTDISFAEFAALDFPVFTSETDRMFETGSESEDELEMSASKQPSQIFESEIRAVESASAAYLVEEPIEQSEQNQGTEIANAVPTADAKMSDDESMTL